MKVLNRVRTGASLQHIPRTEEHIVSVRPGASAGLLGTSVPRLVDELCSVGVRPS